MDVGVAIVLLALAAAPLICGVDFVFYSRAAKQRPSLVWLGGFLLPWVLLIFASAFRSRALLPFAFLAAAAITLGWFKRRNRRR